jgi:hypothetical protein
MMRRVGLVLVCGLLGACQTPPAVQDMSTLTAKFAAQMDTAVTGYVTALNANNASDTARLQDELADAARVAASNADDVSVWHLDASPRAVNVNRLLSAVTSMSVTDATPLIGHAPGAAIAATRASAKITFDDTPLKTIGTVAGGIAKPKTLSDQVAIISAYAQAVQSDVKSATPSMPSK